jgi:hypothetical protein
MWNIFMLCAFKVNATSSRKSLRVG